MDQIFTVLDRISGVITPISQLVGSVATAAQPTCESLVRFYRLYKQMNMEDKEVVVTARPVETWLANAVTQLTYQVQGAGDGQYIMDRETVLALRDELGRHVERGAPVPISVARRRDGDFDVKIWGSVVGVLKSLDGRRYGRSQGLGSSNYSNYSRPYQEEVDCSPAVMIDATPSRESRPSAAYIYSAQRGGNSVQVPATARESAVYSSRPSGRSRASRSGTPPVDDSTIYAGAWSRRSHSTSRADNSLAIYVRPNSRTY